MELTKEQKKAYDFIIGKKFCLIQGDVGFGKTFLALFFISKNPDKKFLVSVHKKEMIEQWKKESTKIFGEVLPNMKIIAFTQNQEKYKIDCLIVDEAHKLKSMGAKFKNGLKKHNYKKLIFLTATPIDGVLDWLMYFKITEIAKNKEEFYKLIQANGFNAKRPDVRYAKYISYKKTPNFKIDKYNKEIIEDWKNKFSIQFDTYKIFEEVKNISTNDWIDIKIKNSIILKNLDQYEKEEENFNQTKLEKLFEISLNFDKEEIIIICKRTFEKELLLENFPQHLILQHQSAKLTGTDGLQKKYSKILFFSPIPSASNIIQSIGRINRNKQKREVEIYKFSNNYENIKWRKTIAKIKTLK